jgi:hypothetical protein
MAMVDVSVVRWQQGHQFGRLIVTLGKVGMEGWLKDGREFVWFEGVRTEAPIDETGRLRWSLKVLSGLQDAISGFSAVEAG